MLDQFESQSWSRLRSAGEEVEGGLGVNSRTDLGPTPSQGARLETHLTSVDPD